MLVVLLPGLVFEAAYRLRLDDLVGVGSPASRSWRCPGVLISAAVVAVVLTLLTGLRPDLAFIVGAIVSATDPAAVVATFKRIPALSLALPRSSMARACSTTGPGWSCSPSPSVR